MIKLENRIIGKERGLNRVEILEGETLGKSFDWSIQAYTMCEKCGEMDWCIVNDIFELCRSCYSGESRV